MAAYPEELPRQTYWNRRHQKAKAILAWFFMSSTPRTIAEIINASYNKLDAMPELDYNGTNLSPMVDSDLLKTILTRFRLNNKYIYQCLAQFSVELSKETYFGLHDLYLKSLTFRRGSRLVIAIKQYHNEHGV
ncbi:MAG: hypothetical protein JXA81_00060 [Sedimentisphaerales bacterium]|nr:hypothetical protein [Sedimentisphaerales bacterium]